MSIQLAVQKAATNMDNILTKSYRINDRVEVDATDLSLIMGALAASWPPKETIDGLTAKIQYLLDEYVPCEEKQFIFPDGDSWVVRNKTKKGDTK